MTVDVKGELSEEEKEAIREAESQKMKKQDKLIDSLEISAPGVNRHAESQREENKENEELGKRRSNSNSLFRNSLLMRKCNLLILRIVI